MYVLFILMQFDYVKRQSSKYFQLDYYREISQTKGFVTCIFAPGSCQNFMYAVYTKLVQVWIIIY